VKTRSGREFSEFSLPMSLLTNVSITSALKDAVAVEDALWDSEMLGSPSSPASHLPQTPRASPEMSSSDLPHGGTPPPPFLGRSILSPLASGPSSLPSRRRRAVSIEALSDLSDLSDLSFLGIDPEELERTSEGSLPAVGAKKRKRPLMESDRKVRRDRHKKQRATEAGKAKQRQRRKVRRSNKPPTNREPQFPVDRGLPQPILSGIKPVSHFPTVSTGYTGDKYVEPILRKQVWTLEMLLERGLEVFEWDGR
jgi:hypothetical protein